MASVKVIVQGIPTHHDNDTNAMNCADDKIKLEELLKIYGPLKCVYLWSNELDKAVDIAPSSVKRQKIEMEKKGNDNFAHIIFENRDDAARACEAAAAHEIMFDNSILTLTLISDESLTPIDDLTDNSLITIISFLDAEERLKMEEVCKHWKKLVADSWANMKKLDLTNMKLTLKMIEKYMIRCGRYINELICPIRSLITPQLILLHCEHISTLKLNIGERLLSSGRHDHLLPEMFMGLKNLKSLSLYHPDDSFPFTFIQHLPESMQEISFISGWFMNQSYGFDFSKFRNLHTLTLQGYNLFGYRLKGIEHMADMTHLDFDKSFTYRSVTKRMVNYTKLKTLKISRSGITDDILTEIIMKNRALEYLDVSVGLILTDHSIQLASRLENLKVLKITRLFVTLEFMGEMPSLEILECQECQNLTDQQIGQIIKLAPNLNRLDIVGSSITSHLFVIANAALKKRDNNVALEILSNQPADVLISMKNVSPLLNVTFSDKRRFAAWREEERLDYPDGLDDSSGDYHVSDVGEDDRVSFGEYDEVIFGDDHEVNFGEYDEDNSQENDKDSHNDEGHDGGNL